MNCVAGPLKSSIVISLNNLILVEHYLSETPTFYGVFAFTKSSTCKFGTYRNISIQHQDFRYCNLFWGFPVVSYVKYCAEEVPWCNDGCTSGGDPRGTWHAVGIWVCERSQGIWMHLAMLAVTQPVSPVWESQIGTCSGERGCCEILRQVGKWKFR